MSDWELRVDDIPEPTPGAGQVLTKVLACGICGSDLHLVQHGEESRRLSEELRRPADPDRSDGGEHVRAVAATSSWATSSAARWSRSDPGVQQPGGRRRRRLMPVAFDASGVHAHRLLEHVPRRLRRADGAQRADGDQGARPDCPIDMAALTEPLAVGVHAVAKSRRSTPARRRWCSGSVRSAWRASPS